ncbi:unnamed protein product, partial [Adineta ricciae]
MLVASGTKIPVIQSIKNQQACGSCYAFATICLLEFQYVVQTKSTLILSEQQVVDCSKSNYGCNGGTFINTFNYIQSNSWQVNTASYYPYKNAAGKCLFKATAPGVRFSPLIYNTVSSNNVVGMQQALIYYGPLYVSFFAGSNSSPTYTSILTKFSSYQSGIWQPNGCPTSSSMRNHAVVIVGYGVDTVTNIPYWK